MKIRLIGFALLTPMNGYITYHLWDVLCIRTLPLCFLALSCLCGVLLLFNIRSKAQLVITYTVNVLVLVFGLAYAIYFRRPLGFYTAFSSAVLFAKNFICGPNCKDKPVTKILSAMLILITAATLTVTTITFLSAIRDPLANGAGVLWSSENENQFNEICIGATDEEKVKASYTWMLGNISYDHNYDFLTNSLTSTKPCRRKRASATISPASLPPSDEAKTSRAMSLTAIAAPTVPPNIPGTAFLWAVFGTMSISLTTLPPKPFTGFIQSLTTMLRTKNL